MRTGGCGAIGRRRPRRDALLLGLLTIPLGAIVLAPMGAGAGATVESRVTLKLKGGPPAHGRVISEEPKCVEGRTVVLLMVAPDSGPIDLADRKTNAKGKWVFSSQLQGATIVRAKVRQRTVGGVTCEAALSPAKSF